MTAMAEGVRLRVQRDTSQLAQAAVERERKLLDVLAAPGTATSSEGSPAVGTASRPSLESRTKKMFVGHHIVPDAYIRL